jgi:hypothetical protein
MWAWNYKQLTMISGVSSFETRILYSPCSQTSGREQDNTDANANENSNRFGKRSRQWSQNSHATQTAS